VFSAYRESAKNRGTAEQGARIVNPVDRGLGSLPDESKQADSAPLFVRSFEKRMKAPKDQFGCTRGRDLTTRAIYREINQQRKKDGLPPLDFRRSMPPLFPVEK